MSKSFETKVLVHYLKKSGNTYMEALMQQEKMFIPTMEPSITSIEEQWLGHDEENHTEDRLGDERDIHMYNIDDNSYFHSVLADEEHFFTDFVECVSNGNVGNT